MITIDEFVQAIRNKNKVRVKFYSKEDDDILERVCAPMDYGPSRRTRNKTDRYHLWNFESDKGWHTLSLLPDQIKDMVVLDEYFNPADFVNWNLTAKPWFIDRNWGKHS